MNTKTLKYISDNQLSSCMNNTKWKELVHELTSIEGYETLVNIKLIFDTDNNNNFSPVWWEEIERDGFELIEWMEIKPYEIEKSASLIVQKLVDYTKVIKKALDKHNIKYLYDNEVFTIYGYKR